MLHVFVDGGEAGHQPQRLFALAEHVERVTQSAEPLAQPLNLTREQLILALERAALRDVDAARQRCATEQEDQQRDNAAEADERFENRLGNLHGA